MRRAWPGRSERPGRGRLPAGSGSAGNPGPAYGQNAPQDGQQNQDPNQGYGQNQPPAYGQDQQRRVYRILRRSRTGTTAGLRSESAAAGQYLRLRSERTASGIWTELSTTSASISAAAAVWPEATSSAAYEMPSEPITVPPGTLMQVRTNEPVSSKQARGGEPIQFTLIQDVVLNEVLAIPRGATFMASLPKSDIRRRVL